MGAPAVLGVRQWQALQARFLAGEPASALARAYGVAEGTIRKRAQRGGWTRAAAARAWSEAAPDDPTLDPALVPPGLPPHLRDLAVKAVMSAPPPVPHHADLARLALRSASAALVARDGLGAMRLIRAAEQISDLDRSIGWVEDFGADPESLEREHANRRAVQMEYVHALAVGLARMLAHGETVPEPFASMFAAEDSSAAGGTAGSEPRRRRRRRGRGGAHFGSASDAVKTAPSGPDGR